MDKLKQIIESQKQHLLITGGRRSGLTYSLLTKALNMQGGVAFVTGFRGDESRVLKQAVDILKSHNYEDYRVRNCNLSYNKVLETNHNSITFVNGSCISNYFWLKPNIDLICVDQPEQLKGEHVKDIVNFKSRGTYPVSKAFATQPFNCAYRNPEYVNGVVVRDEKGNPLYKGYSWDKELLNWAKVDEDNTHKKIITKLSPEHYKSSVEVITLGNVENPYPTNNLSWEARQLLTGEWKGSK